MQCVYQWLRFNCVSSNAEDGNSMVRMYVRTLEIQGARPQAS